MGTLFGYASVKTWFDCTLTAYLVGVVLLTEDQKPHSFTGSSSPTSLMEMLPNNSVCVVW